MKKKIIIVLSVLTMILSLTACSSNSPAKEEVSGEVENETSKQEEVSGEVKNETSKQDEAEMQKLKETIWKAYSDLTESGVDVDLYFPTNFQ